MKLAALYTVFNGLELLEGSIDQIIGSVDMVIISFQEVSNRGEFSSEVRQFMERFSEREKIKVLEYDPVFNVDTKQNERNKHQQLINEARKNGCTHFFLSACDHYYQPEQFDAAKRTCERNGYDVTFTRMFTYYKHPEWRIDPPETYFMPFICRIYPETTVTQNAHYPVLTDPSVRVSPWFTFHIFQMDEIVMHHYSMIRQDIENKFRNAAAAINKTPERTTQLIEEYNSAEVGSSISYFKGAKIIEVDNIFSI